jgi:type II secretory pathway component PulM
MTQQSAVWQEKLSAWWQKTKALLSKDYSLDDLKNLGQHAKDLKDKLLQAKDLSVLSGLSSGKGTADGLNAVMQGFEIKQVPQLLQTVVVRLRTPLLILLVLILVYVLNMMVLNPYEQRLQEQINLRPAQWSQLQSLIKQSKTTVTASGAASRQSLGAPTTVSTLNEAELQTIQRVFSSRGVKPSVLRITTDNPPQLELQANEVLFSTVLDALEELRTTWRLYPEQLNVVAASSAGLVNIGGSLVQPSMNRAAP